MSFEIRYADAVQPEQLPAPLAKLPVRTTVSPLRAGERNRPFMKASNLWGDQPEKTDPDFTDFVVGKELENIAVCIEDIDHLIAILMLLRNASDYSQKLLGKYAILELHSVAACFKSLARASTELKIIAESYENALAILDAKHHFPNIRNKIAAHKHDDSRGLIGVSLERQNDLWKHITLDAIGDYLDCLQSHLAQVQVLHPEEYKSNILMNGQVLQGALGSPPDDDYTEFLTFANDEAMIHDLIKKTEVDRDDRQ